MSYAEAGEAFDRKQMRKPGTAITARPSVATHAAVSRMVVTASDIKAMRLGELHRHPPANSVSAGTREEAIAVHSASRGFAP
jgi:hypothetical protein